MGICQKYLIISVNRISNILVSNIVIYLNTTQLPFKTINFQENNTYTYNTAFSTSKNVMSAKMHPVIREVLLWI